MKLRTKLVPRLPSVFWQDAASFHNNSGTGPLDGNFGEEFGRLVRLPLDVSIEDGQLTPTNSTGVVPHHCADAKLRVEVGGIKPNLLQPHPGGGAKLNTTNDAIPVA